MQAPSQPFLPVAQKLNAGGEPRHLTHQGFGARGRAAGSAQDQDKDQQQPKGKAAKAKKDAETKLLSGR